MNLLPTPNPAASYAEAVQRFDQSREATNDGVSPTARSILLTHGAKAAKVVVYFHGYTNAPPQFTALGQTLFEKGYNILVPRLPYHGLDDRLTTEQARLAASDLAQTADEALDIAQGLGEKVIVTGLSAGGVMTAWAAQFRDDVDKAVVIAPAFGLPFVPFTIGQWAKRAALRLPNYFVWWDPRAKANIKGPPHAYPRFSTHGLAQIITLGDFVREAATKAPPKAREIVLITSGMDTAVHNPTARRVARMWELTSGTKVEQHEFPRREQVFHDMIDPTNPFQKTEVVYPILLKHLA
jgi:alpha-beta hydrolase superfamily lysophospholipase